MRPRGSLIAVALGLLVAGSALAGTPFMQLDFCHAFFERALDRHDGSCNWSPPLRYVGERAIWSTIGAHYLLTVPESDAPSTKLATLDAPLPNALVDYARYTDSCYSTGYWRTDGAQDHTLDVESYRPQTPPIQWVLWPRVDLMSFTEMALPGVRQEWFATTDQSWATTLANITGDTSTVCTTTCGGACAHSYYFANNASERHSVPAYASLVPPATPSAWETFVYYWPHPNHSDICNVYEVDAVMKLHNAEYRAWKLERLRGLLNDAPWAWGFEFDTKWSYRMCRDSSRVWHATEHYLGGTRLPDCTVPSGGTITMQHYNDTNDTPFSAPFASGQGAWTDYVQGYRAFMEAAKAAGIRVQLRMPTHLYAWWKSDGGWGGYTGDNCGGVGGVACDYYDDPNTLTHNENDDVKAIYRAAARVFFETTTNSYTKAAEAGARADLESYGVEVVKWDYRGCGETP